MSETQEKDFSGVHCSGSMVSVGSEFSALSSSSSVFCAVGSSDSVPPGGVSQQYVSQLPGFLPQEARQTSKEALPPEELMTKPKAHKAHLSPPGAHSDELEIRSASQWLENALSLGRMSFNDHLVSQHHELMAQFNHRFVSLDGKGIAEPNSQCTLSPSRQVSCDTQATVVDTLSDDQALNKDSANLSRQSSSDSKPSVHSLAPPKVIGARSTPSTVKFHRPAVKQTVPRDPHVKPFFSGQGRVTNVPSIMSQSSSVSDCAWQQCDTVETSANDFDFPSMTENEAHPHLTLAKRRFTHVYAKNIEDAAAKEAEIDFDQTRGWPCRLLSSFVRSTQFEIAMVLVIVANSLMMCVKAQYVGLTIANEHEFYGYTDSTKDSWPHAELVFDTLDSIFGVAYVMEVVLKILVYQIKFPLSFWHWFDTFIVVVWMFALVHDAGSVDPNMFRLMRFLRLLRLVRLVRAFQVFDVLHLLISSLKASGIVLAWSLIFLTAVMCMLGLLLNTVLETFILDTTKPADHRNQVFLYFGTFARTMMSMWTITLGNPAPIAELLINTVSEWFVLIFLIHHAVLGFATITVVRAIFLQQTLKVSQTDAEIMIREKERQISTNAVLMLQLFEQGDLDGDGLISFHEFQILARTPKMKAFISALGLEVPDAEEVFRLLNTEGTGQLNINTLMDGFTRLKGTAKSIDIVLAMDMLRRLEDSLAQVTLHLGLHEVRPSGFKESVFQQHLKRMQTGDTESWCEAGSVSSGFYS